MTDIADHGWAFETAVRTLWQESRGDGLLGQKAVAAVIVNRLRDGRWGTSLGSVCLWRGQFSGWSVFDPNFKPSTALADSSPDLEPLRRVMAAAIAGDDPTGGALFYYAPSLASPKWAEPLRHLGQFGTQVFLTENRKTQPSS